MTNRTAVVVGGASGIGKAVAHALAADGCRVTVADRNGDGARSVATELGDPHTAATVEVTDEDSVRGAVRPGGRARRRRQHRRLQRARADHRTGRRRLSLGRRRLPDRRVPGDQARRTAAAQRRCAGVDQLAERPPARRGDERLLGGQGGMREIAHLGSRAPEQWHWHQGEWTI